MKSSFTASLKTMALLLSSLLIPTQAFAHLRWFVDVNSPSAQAYQQAMSRFQFDLVYLFLLAGAVGFVISAITLDNLARKNQLVGALLNAPIKLPLHLEWRLVSILLGLMLLMNSHHGVLLAPNLPTSDEFMFKAAIIVQFVVGLLFISQLSFVLSAIGTFCLALIASIITPAMIMIDYVFEFAGIMVAFYLIGPSISRIDRILWPASSPRNEQMAVAVLALSLGLQLAELALHNKLLNPGLALIFIDDNGFLNFMRMIGFTSFKNIYFVFAGGIAELILGTLLVFGIATRFVALGIGAIFTLTSAIFGLHELIGHIPIMAVVLLIALHGKKIGLLSLVRSTLKEQNAKAVPLTN
ncbi:MAG: hypothetical protein L3J67_00185 [Hyphomicrobiaceae bacterium]|nr:hypothetical protein [Hyphomicrobiaceae bacterium]